LLTEKPVAKCSKQKNPPPPKKTTHIHTHRKGLEQWQRQWNSSEKGAMCRSFFPRLEQRLKTKVPITHEFTALVTRHGKTKSYLHRF